LKVGEAVARQPFSFSGVSALRQEMALCLNPSGRRAGRLIKI
jgi:hypothetical protein